jgi:hypothetical protein
MSARCFCSRCVSVSRCETEKKRRRSGLTKTLRQNILRGMRDPIIHVETRPRRLKISIIKDEKILILVRQTLDNMRLTLGEVPDIALVQHFNLVAAVLVHGADSDLAVIDVTPLSHAVPMHLTDGVLGQVLLGACDVLAGWEVGNDLFSHPAAWELAGFGVGEAPFEVFDIAGIGGFLA